MAILDVIHSLAGHHAASTQQATTQNNDHHQHADAHGHFATGHHDTSHTTAHNFLSQLSLVGHTAQQGLTQPSSQQVHAQVQGAPFAAGSIASSVVTAQSAHGATEGTNSVHLNGLVLAHVHGLTCGDYNI